VQETVRERVGESAGDTGMELLILPTHKQKANIVGHKQSFPRLARSAHFEKETNSTTNSPPGPKSGLLLFSLLTQRTRPTPGAYQL
jgi:hypothetical protein